LLDCEGLHLSSRQQPPVQLIERLLTSPAQRPLEWFRQPSRECLARILALLRRALNDLVTSAAAGSEGDGSPLSRCPRLRETIARLLDERFAHWERVGDELIEQLVRAQRFLFQVEPLDLAADVGDNGAGGRRCSHAASSSLGATTPDRVRALAAAYYAANPVRDFQSMLPRLLMTQVVDDTQRYLRDDLLLAVHAAYPDEQLVALLQPDASVAIERAELECTSRVLASVQALVRALR